MHYFADSCIAVMKAVLLLLLASHYVVHSATIYDARLSGGYHGSVQVLTQQGWLQLCSPSWHISRESRVLCRQLGYGIPYDTSRTSSSGTLVYIHDIGCSGIEAELSECNNYYYSSNGVRTSCSYTVSVWCTQCTSGRIRLHQGIVPEAGTVEYCVSGTWRAVCDNVWDYQDAFVVCQQLGFPATGAVNYRRSYFGDSSFTFGMYFNCFGNESSLSNCKTTSTTCYFANTAGVFCTGDMITERCINGHIRLAGSNNTYEGRVEICSNGLWGTIWGGGWDSLDAIVVCKQLGLYQPYSRVEVFYSGFFGEGTGPVLYTYLNCDGSETTLAGCGTYHSFYYSAPHSSDAGVRCNRIATSARSSCSNGNIRLVNGSTSSEGRVEICYEGVWGSVCDSGWDYWDAAIVCLQLGFQGTNATALRNSYFGDGTGPYHLSNVGCSGEERTLLQCSYGYSTIGYHTCPSGRDAGVRCDASSCTHGEVRLFGGYTDHDGVAEVCINGYWADICSDASSDRTTITRTFCRQLTGQETSFYYSTPCCGNRRNTGNITLYGIRCIGFSLPFVQDCQYSTVLGYSSGSCNLQQEITVGCYEQSNCTNGDLHLRGGINALEGRVEFCRQGIWGTIAAISWDAKDAMVVCRQLGHPWGWAIDVHSDVFGKRSTRNIARHVHCSGTEQRLIDCPYSSIPISSDTSYEIYTYAGVICQGNNSVLTECEHGKVRLVGGQKISEGRVEICAYGYWASTCNHHWDTVETEMVCKQLGFPVSASEYVSGSQFGANYELPIVSVSCSISNSAVSECNIFTQLSNCNHANIIGIYCTEREQYNIITTDIFPVQESYEIGSQVMLNCTLNPTSLHGGDVVSYQNSAQGGTYYSAKTTLTVPAYYLNSVDYYCHVYRNGRLLEVQRTTLNIQGLLQQKNALGSPSIKVHELNAVHLETRIQNVNVNILNSLLNLTWYHNGSVISQNQNPRYTFSNGNKTLTITNYSSVDAGIYQVQFDQLFVHPFDNNCKEEVLSLLKDTPVLKPVVFCVNMEENCVDTISGRRMRDISVARSSDSVDDLQGTLTNIKLKASGIVLSTKELQYATIRWYRNGHRITSALSSLQRNYNNMSLTQELQVFNVTYEHTGRYEVLLSMDWRSYLQDSNCKPYYDRFVRQYLSITMPIAKGYVDIGYYKELMFNLGANKEVATKDEGAVVFCRASIQFPPFSMLSLIKNGQTVATSTSGALQINIKSVNANPFGLYICQLNASGVVFQKSSIIKEQAFLMTIMDIEDFNTCSSIDKSIIEDALVSRISRHCRCNFDENDFHRSSTACKGNTLVYTATLEYSNNDGSETASVIAERIAHQAPFSMIVQEIPVTVTSACSDCGATLSPGAGIGLFIGGFVIATLLTCIVILVIMGIMKRRGFKSVDSGHGKQRQQESELRAKQVRYHTTGQQRESKTVDRGQRQQETELRTKPVRYHATGAQKKESKSLDRGRGIQKQQEAGLHAKPVRYHTTGVQKKETKSLDRRHGIQRQQEMAPVQTRSKMLEQPPAMETYKAMEHDPDNPPIYDETY